MSKKILLVEDAAILAMTETLILKKHGYEVITANTGEKAVDTADLDSGISLILMDIDLGKGIDGTEAAEKILAKHDLPIVFLSSHTDFSLSSKKAILLGIILNELLTNVFKYAFTGRNEGHVSIDIEKNEKRVRFTIIDDGTGIDTKADKNKSPGFGLTMVTMLAEQLEGTFSIRNDNGTKSVLEFDM